MNVADAVFPIVAFTTDSSSSVKTFIVRLSDVVFCSLFTSIFAFSVMAVAASGVLLVSLKAISASLAATRRSFSSILSCIITCILM